MPTLALALPAVDSTVEAVSPVIKSLLDSDEAVFHVILSLLEVVSPSVATAYFVLGFHYLSAAILDLFLELFSIFHYLFHKAFCLSVVMICQLLCQQENLTAIQLNIALYSLNALFILPRLLETSQPLAQLLT